MDPLNQPNLIVLHQDYISAKNLQNKLKNMGYEVPNIVISLEDTFEKLEQTNPDVVLIDSEIKGTTDGHEIAHRIHSEYRIPVVLLSVVPQPDNLHKWGYYCCCIEPLNEKELSLLIDLALFEYAMEKKLLEIEMTISHILEHSSDGILLLNGHNKIIQMNPVAENYIGKTFESVRGQIFTDMVQFVLNGKHKGEEKTSSSVIEKNKLVHLRNCILQNHQGVTDPLDVTVIPLHHHNRSKKGTLLLLKPPGK